MYRAAAWFSDLSYAAPIYSANESKTQLRRPSDSAPAWFYGGNDARDYDRGADQDEDGGGR
jgi:hypothetical protein